MVLGAAQYVIVHWMFGSVKWKNEIAFMIGRAETVPHRMMEYYLLACWTVISPVMILGILMFYCYDVIALTPPSYYKWDRSIGGWAQDNDGPW